MLIMQETLWENSFKFVQDVHMTLVNFIITVIIVSKEKIEGFTFIPNLYCGRVVLLTLKLKKTVFFIVTAFTISDLCVKFS